jgi:hypothetical protein
MKINKHFILISLLVLSLAFFNSCKRTGINEPSPFGPSTYSLLLSVSASPNVVFAGTSREISTISVTLKKYDGSPVSGQTIHFQVRDILGQRVNVGLFDGNMTAVSRVTDQNGLITLAYHGPFANEMTADAQIYIYALIDWQGTDYITEFVPIYIIQDVTEVVFELYAQPNVIYCTSIRPQSLLKAVFKKNDGSPLADRRVYFYVLSGPGEFEDGKRKTYVLTDSNGIATINYIGPTNDEIGYDQFVELRGQPETSTPFYIHTEVSVRLIKGEE